jgi:hypothetical protein
MNNAQTSVSTSRSGSCPRWCDGVHDPDFPLGRLHGRTVAEHGGAAVSLAYIERDDPRRDDGTVVFIDARASADPVRLEEAQAACLLQALEAFGDGTSWLADTLRAALALLEPATA